MLSSPIAKKVQGLPAALKFFLFFAINVSALYLLKYWFGQENEQGEIEGSSRLIWILSALIITFTYYLFFPRNKKAKKA
jgi:hypothetical protein